MAKATVKKKKVVLNFEGEKGSEVLVAGSFNDWDLQPKKKGNKAKVLKEKDGGQFTINMFLPEGEYEYKFFVNGEWKEDSNAEVRKQNVFGTFNSILTVA